MFSFNLIIGPGNRFYEKVLDLKYNAALAGEFTVISHDETFKTLFSLIGQNKMAQATGELHALHTFRGYTGCTFGVSAQRSTGHQCFRAAVDDIFDKHLAGYLKFIFSDSRIRIIKVARTIFKELLAVGEDPIHLPIRLEYCWGEATTKASARVRQLHWKFNIPTLTIEPFWQPEDTRRNNSHEAFPTDSGSPNSNRMVCILQSPFRQYYGIF